MSNATPHNPKDGETSKKEAGRADSAQVESYRGFKQLRDLIDQHFTLEEIQGLCFDLTIEFEHLAGHTRPLKIQNLITHLAQRQRLPDLLYWLNQQRPLVDWPAAEQADWQPAAVEQTAMESLTALVSERPGRMTQYLDFEVQIGPGVGRAYPVVVVHSPAGEARETMQFPYDELALENRLQSLQIALLHAGGATRQMLTSEERLVQEFGQELFDALLTGETRSRFDVSCAAARQQSKGLRLKLRIQPPELARLPWEFLYDPRRAEYICLSRETPIIRYLELPQPIQPLAINPPLRILGMTVSPRGLPPLDIEREKLRVETAVRPLQASGIVHLTWLAGSSWRDLQRAMRAGPWHIFHFIGHGGFDSQADEGFIALANETGEAHRLLATELGRLLADHHSLRLVLLNSCEGARGSQHDIFSSSASILVRRGLPAVLAMQYAITDRAAIEFARAFYEALTDNLPVDAAVAEARKAVSLAMSYTVEWGTPVLYMRAPQGIIFKIAAAPHPAPIDLTETGSDLTQRLEQLYTDGLGAYWVGDWDKACRRFQKILDVQPGYGDTAVRLAEAQRQKKLQTLYQQAQAAGTDWAAAITALEEIVADKPDYQDALALLAVARQQKQLADLYGEARRLHDAGQWPAVVNILGQIRGMEADYPDPDDLLATAEREVAESQRQAELNRLYGRAVREMDAGQWDTARQLLATVAEMEPDYREIKGLLARVEEAAARAEVEQQQQAQITAGYEQALSLARAGQWPQVLTKMQEIAALDPHFADSEGITERAKAEIGQAELEAQRQEELAALYAGAVDLLQAQEYQAALKKWREVQALDAHYPDRQKVERTATKKLKQLSQTATPSRRWSRKRWLWLGGVVGVVTAVILLLIFNPFDDKTEGGSTAATSATAPAHCPEITDWQAEYWANQELQGDPVLCHNELTVDHDWVEDSPAAAVPNDNFSARFTQTLNFAESTQRFTLGSDDGARLWVDDVLVIDRWIDSSYVETFADVALEEGDHKLQVDYFENGGTAKVTLDWTAVSQCAPGVIYCEDFENGRADNWQLKSGWEVVEADANQHYLQGSENEFVILQHIGWEDYRLRFRFKLEKGIFHTIFRYMMEEVKWYVIGITETGRYYLSKTEAGNNIGLANSQSLFASYIWHDAEIIGEGKIIQVYVDGALVLEYEDENPVRQGPIAFEPLTGSLIKIDDVEIWPVYVAFSAPTIDGYLVDWCTAPGLDCGEPAATAWCQQQGYAQAADFEKDHNIGARGLEAMTIGSGQIFTVDAFKSITCR